MSPERPVGWIDRRVRAAMRVETDAMRAEIAALADAVQIARDADRAQIAEARVQAAALQGLIEALGAELRGFIEQTDGKLHALREATERDERIEMLRLRLDGFSAQHRWDIEQLRQSLAAVAERLPIIG